MRPFVALSILAVLFFASGASAVSLEGSPEFQVNVSTVGEQHSPDLATDTAGNTMVVWNSDHNRLTPRLYGRIYDASGAPRTGELEIADPGTAHQLHGKVVADPAGGFLVVWAQGSGISARRFDVNGAPLGGAFPVSASGSAPAIAVRPAGGFFLVWADAVGIRGAILDGNATPGPVLTLHAGADSGPSLAVAPWGDVVVSWSMGGNGFLANDIGARLFDGDLNPKGHAFLVNPETPYEAGYQFGPAGVFHSNGSFSIVWVTAAFNASSARPGLFGRTFAGAGQPQAGIVEIYTEDRLIDLYAPALASDPLGRILILWSGSTSEDDMGVVGQFFGPSLQPLGDPFLANLFKVEAQFQPAVVADAHGGFTAVWTSGSGYPAILPRGDEGLSSQDGNFYGVFGRRFSGCVPGEGHLCLGSGRFRVEVAWTDHDGNSGTGKTRVMTDDTGAFWFFGPGNLELMVKVLDGRGVNGHFWVFYGALSDVQYTITVTDTLTDTTRTYTNPSGRMASRADVEAFSDPVPPPAAAQAAAVALPLTPPLSCSAGATELCLGERFAVSVQFVDPRTGIAGQGRAVPLTADTGAFWFFEQENFELMVKALDGRPVNNRFWIFYGALSDVEYTITVRDILTDETRTYRNPAGTMASRADTRAFPLQ